MQSSYARPRLFSMGQTRNIVAISLKFSKIQFIEPLNIADISRGLFKVVYKDNFMTTWNSWFSGQATIWYKT